MKENIYDVIIIGGGASGMMAAASIDRGNKVLIIEKNRNLGKKLLITGGGRCNLTNAEFDLRKFLKNYKKAEPFLYSAFSQYGVDDTIKYFNDRNMETKIEAYGRVFPVSDNAKSVFDVLLNDIKKNKNLEILSDTKVENILFSNGKIDGIKTDKNIYKAKKYILATGGTSHPETGSTGDAYIWLKDMGHTIHKPKASLVPVVSFDKWIKDIQGLTIDNIKISLYENNKKIDTKKGKILFTHFGLSGPSILNMSKQISDSLDKKNKIFISLDLMSQYDHGALNKYLTDLLQNNPKKKISNILSDILNKKIVNIVLQNSKINEDLTGTQITKDMRIVLIENLKNLKINIHGLLDENNAIVSDGGVDLKEIDFKTMQSKIIKNLYIIGDLLNIDRPSGGYSLQICWTTGYLAGRSK